MFNIKEKIESIKMTRRSFIGWSAAVTVSASIPFSRGLTMKAKERALGETIESEEEVWKSAACWHNCGGGCINDCY